MKRQLMYAFLLQILFISIVKGQGYENQQKQESVINLSGTWGIALDINDEGVHKKWYMGALTDTIRLPGTTDIAGYGVPDQSPWINYLQRKHKYIGVVWYQKKVLIPESWDGYLAELVLERVKWESRVWIDGKEVSNPCDGLVTAHSHALGKLLPGEHVITVRVDNRMIHPIGDKGHNYTEQMESIWNGIVGKIELRRRATASIERVRIFPDYEKKIVEAEIQIRNTNTETPQAVSVLLSLTDKKGNDIAKSITKKQILSDSISTFRYTIPVKNIAEWSEFSQPLYTADCKLKVGSQTDFYPETTFAFRSLKTTPYKIVVNGVPAFMRGNQEALCYPPTGYPPTDIDTWRRIFSIYKSYNLNQVRFHSACPPEAAFQAADELGIYMMVELVWMTSINAKSDLRPISATMGIPQGLGNNDRSIDDFVYRETRRLLDQYGNHPSFCFFAFGNEMDNLNKEKIDNWICELKTDDPRRLYSGTTARMVLPHDDFQDSHVVPGKGSIVNKAGNPSTMVNYDSTYVHTTVPVIAHELGQFPVYPSWKEIEKYKHTPFRFINLERSRELAKKNGIDTLAESFRKASGHLQQVLYKEEIERQFLSAYSAGFNLLQMNDYPGQGEALVGWLDAFYDSKGITTPELFSRFCNTLVPLACFPKRVYLETESPEILFKAAYYGEKAYQAGFSWKLISDRDGSIIDSGQLDARSILPGGLYSLGSCQLKLPKTGRAATYQLQMTSLDGQFSNDWRFWVYPAEINIDEKEIYTTNSMKEAMDAASAGEKVLFLAHESGVPEQKNLSSFVPVFWSTIFFPGAGTQTLGALVRSTHPALAHFPSDSALDWQWQDLCNHSRGTILDGEAASIEPIVQPIDDFHANRKLASLYELNYGKGKILVCGYDLETNLAQRPVARQLRFSLLQYMKSADFTPTHAVSAQWLATKYPASQSSPKGGKQQLGEWTVDLPVDMLLKRLAFNKFELNSTVQTIGSIEISGEGLEHKDQISIRINGREASLEKSQPKELKVTYFREDFDNKRILVEIKSKDNKNPINIKTIKITPDKN